MTSLIGKARKPKFELHLHIHDLNNVPLVSGSSYIKWHLVHSMHAEHRGRTSKCPIANHRVDYSFSKLIPSIRISVDKNNQLAECPIEFEILQEFALAEKITLGHVRLNLSEYVEESEMHLKDSLSPGRRRNDSVSVSPTSAAKASSTSTGSEEHVEEGIVRRYLMQDSKINSTLRVSILMVQVDGERNYIAPTLRTAPVFGGIAGLMAPEAVEDEIGPLPNISKSRDQSELQDLYRRTLAASWQRQPGELPADECIEDIFSGGNGWRTRAVDHTSDHDDTSPTRYDTLRPSDLRRMGHGHGHGHGGHHFRHRRSNSQTDQRNHQHHHHLQHGDGKHHRRSNSASSDRSSSTVVGSTSTSTTAAAASASTGSHKPRAPYQERTVSRISLRDDQDDDDLARSRRGSLGSLAPTLDSDRGRDHGGLKRVREVHEGEIREDLVAWRLPGMTAA